MKKNIFVKQLREINGNTFKALHNTFGFDFQTEFAIKKINGSFTLRQALTELDTTGLNTDNAQVVIAVRPYSSLTSIVKVVEVVSATKFNNDFYLGGKGVYNYSTKSDFNEDRKEDDIVAFVIAQRFDYLKPEKTKKPDQFTRAYVNPKTPYREYSSYDRSGYVRRRVELSTRASEIRREKEKKAYLESDNTEKIIILDAKLDELKKEIKTRFLTATTAEDYEKVGNALRDWSGLPRCMKEVDEYKTRTALKDYDSIGNSDGQYNYALERIEGCMSILNR